MKYLSVCSGIEAASAAWHPLGWDPVAFSEIEKFPSAVLAHHYPSTPNWGDMTKFKEWPDADVDVLVGGTPCQSFSVAGLRKGLADPRGNLCLTFLAIADKYRPQWLLWENVPGVLSSDGGRDFGAFLGGLGQLGYGWSYRVLDAQYVRVDGFPRAVPQRRRRVFVVGHPGDWRRAAAVLFERESLQGNIAPRRQAGQGTAATVAPSLVSGVTGALNSAGGHAYPGQANQDFNQGFLIPSTSDVSHRLNAGGMGRQDYETETLVAHALRADGFVASEDGTGRGTPLVPIAYSAMPMNSGKDFVVRETDVAQPIMAAGPSLGNQGGDYIAQAVVHCVDMGGNKGMNGGGLSEGFAPPLNTNEPHVIANSWAVRRLTPRECERLQGFPDDYTQVPHRGKPAADGPRYKALGNSMAVNCMRWIGRRIEMVESIT